MVADSVLTLLLVPPLIAGLGLLLWQHGRWDEVLAGAGLVGMSITGWFDLADNCAFAHCAEDDPLVMTLGWLVFVVLLACGMAGLLVRALARSRRGL